MMIAFAIMPPPVSLDYMIAVTSRSATNILSFLDEMVKQGILNTDPALGRGYYQFAHQPHFADEIISKSNQTQLQKIAKNAISFVRGHSKSEKEKALVVTHLCCLSEIHEVTAEECILSAEHCLKFYLNEYAGRYYRFALNILTDRRLIKEEKKRYVDATIGLVSAVGHIVPQEDQMAYVLQAIVFAKQIKDKERLAHLLITSARVHQNTGAYTKASQFYENAWDLSQQIGNKKLMRLAALSNTELLFWKGYIKPAVERYEKAIGNLEQISSDNLTLRACATLGWCYGICGQVARGLGLIDTVRTKISAIIKSAPEITVDQVHRDELKSYADLMRALCLLEARRLPEAETYIARVICVSEQVLDHKYLWLAHSADAFIKISSGDTQACLRGLKKAAKYKPLASMPFFVASWYLEMLYSLHQTDLLPQHLKLDDEIDKMMGLPDNLLQIVVLRFKAQETLELSGVDTSLVQDLEGNLDILHEAKANLELARIKILLARFYLNEGRTNYAVELLKQSWLIVAPVNEEIFPQDLRKFLGRDEEEIFLFDTIIKVSENLGTVREHKQLLERIIDSSMRLGTAERGGLFLRRGNNELECVASRNLDYDTMRADSFLGRKKLIDEVAGSGLELIQDYTPNVDGGKKRGISYGWSMCLPVVLRNKISGVLYLDGSNQLTRNQGKAVGLLRAICSQIGIALDNAKAYEEIADLRDRLEAETQLYRMRPSSNYDTQIVGNTKPLRAVLDRMRKVAPSNVTVLITGETGVGKELVARGIHEFSSRKKGPFIATNTAALDPNLVTSELFGHEKGAFTGATGVHIGRFELAHNGTIFLDDVQNLSAEIQAKLLRTLQEKEFERVGGSKVVKSDFRLIAATNQMLDELVNSGNFRSDLFYRLNVFPIIVPPLRDRKDDIPQLVNYFLDTSGRELGGKKIEIPDDIMIHLLNYNWPGNIRELKAVIERIVILEDYSPAESLAMKCELNLKKYDDDTQPWMTLNEMERYHIIRSLEKCNWKVAGTKGAAQLLDLQPTTLYSKMKKLEIKRPIRKK